MGRKGVLDPLRVSDPPRGASFSQSTGSQRCWFPPGVSVPLRGAESPQRNQSHCGHEQWDTSSLQGCSVLSEVPVPFKAQAAGVPDTLRDAASLCNTELPVSFRGA